MVGIGADLAPGTLLAAYRSGLFPMPMRGTDGVIVWWSPDPRGVLPLDELRVSRSLRRSLRRYEVRIDTAFDAVIDGCRLTDRDGGWITPAVREAYIELHELGWAHSVEAWTPDGELVGGLYGVAIGGLFAGESMFHTRPDASKVALVELVRKLGEGEGGAGGGALLDVQWQTDHLRTLGVVEITRDEYLRRLAKAIRLPLPPVFA